MAKIKLTYGKGGDDLGDILSKGEVYLNITESESSLSFINEVGELIELKPVSETISNLLDIIKENFQSKELSEPIEGIESDTIEGAIKEIVSELNGLDTIFQKININIDGFESDTVEGCLSELLDKIENGSADAKFSGKATVTVGGITKGKIYSNAKVVDVLTDLLCPYTSPKLSVTADLTRVELGVASSVKFTIKIEQGSLPIVSVISGGVNVTNNYQNGHIVELSGNGNGDYLHEVSASDDRTTVKQNVTVAVEPKVMYCFSQKENVTSDDILSMTKGKFFASDQYIVNNTVEDAYFWFCIPNRAGYKVSEMRDGFNTPITIINTGVVDAVYNNKSTQFICYKTKLKFATNNNIIINIFK